MLFRVKSKPLKWLTVFDGRVTGLYALRIGTLDTIQTRGMKTYAFILFIIFVVFYFLSYFLSFSISLESITLMTDLGLVVRVHFAFRKMLLGLLFLPKRCYHDDASKTVYSTRREEIEPSADLISGALGTSQPN